MATLIGLCIRVRLLRALPDRFKVDIRVKKGSHESENSRKRISLRASSPLLIARHSSEQATQRQGKSRSCARE